MTMFLLSAGALLTLGAPFNHGAVLQRDMKIPVWGTSVTGETVTISFGEQRVEAKVAPDGRWRAELAPMPACGEGRTLRVGNSLRSIVLYDVLVGEVWLCAGQSNMEQPLGLGGNGWADKNGAIEAKLTDETDIRYLSSGGKFAATPQETVPDGNGTWRTFTRESLVRFPNIPYHFAMNLRRGLKGVPIGLLHASCGGSKIQPWISAEGYAAVPELDDLRKAGRLVGADTPEAKGIGYWTLIAQPTVFFNGKIAPLAAYPFRGVVWYQGESNVADGDRYRLYLHALVRGWRKAFGREEMDFYIVQPTPHLYKNRRETVLGELWTAQQKFVAEDGHAAYVVSDDSGVLNEEHSPYKRDIGLRIALCALNRQYGRTDLEYRSPQLKSARARGGVVTLEFRFASFLYTPAIAGPVRNFELAGADGVWHPAEGKIESGRVSVWSDAVADPVKVRYMYRLGMQGDLYARGTNLMPGAFVADVEAQEGK